MLLAAVIGPRFAGGIKQLQSVGPSGEVIMDYSIHDAIEAGFNRFAFIIRHDIQELFNQIMGDRTRAICAKKGVEALCAYQEKTNLPGGFVCPGDWVPGALAMRCSSARKCTMAAERSSIPMTTMARMPTAEPSNFWILWRRTHGVLMD